MLKRHIQIKKNNFALLICIIKFNYCSKSIWNWRKILIWDFKRIDINIKSCSEPWRKPVLWHFWLFWPCRMLLTWQWCQNCHALWENAVNVQQLLVRNMVIEINKNFAKDRIYFLSCLIRTLESGQTFVSVTMVDPSRSIRFSTLLSVIKCQYWPTIVLNPYYLWIRNYQQPRIGVIYHFLFHHLNQWYCFHHEKCITVMLNTFLSYFSRLIHSQPCLLNLPLSKKKVSFMTIAIRPPPANGTFVDPNVTIS